MAFVDLPDWNIPIYISGITIASIPIDIVAQTIGVVRIDITSQTLGVVNVNIAAIGVVTMNVNITGSVQLNVNIAAIGPVTMNVNITGSIQLNVNIAASAITLNVNLASSAITLNVNISSITGGVIFNVNISSITGGVVFNVNITGSVALNVNITGSVALSVNATQVGAWNVNATEVGVWNVNANITGSVAINVNVTGSVELNIKTTGGANIIIDKLTVSAYTERRSTLSNYGDLTGWVSSIGASWRSKFFPRGCRGFINTIDIYCKDAGAAGGTITIYIAPYIGAGVVKSAAVAVPAGGGEAWRSAVFKYMWNYDSMFIYFLGSSADMVSSYSVGPPYDHFESVDAGVTWSSIDARMWFRVIMVGETCGDVPVSGVVNVIPFPGDAAIARPFWYDRNSVMVTQNWFNVVGPHAATQRWSYTVPAGKKAFVEIVSAQVMRTSAAGTVNVAQGIVFYTPNGGAQTLILQVMMCNNTVGVLDNQNIGQSMVMLAGDLIEFDTADISLGGTHYLSGSCKITEFDA